MIVKCLIMVNVFFAGKWQEAPRLVKGELIREDGIFATVYFFHPSHNGYRLPAQPMQVLAKRCEAKR